MGWLVLLALAAALVALAALTGLKPRGTKPVAGTHLLAAGRVVLLVAAAVLAAIALRGLLKP